MRVFVATLGALVMIASGSLPADAQTQGKQTKSYVTKEVPLQAGPRGNGYREQLADKLPYGSQAWWDQMRREGRLGGETR